MPGNLVVDMTYDKVHLFSKNDGTETEMDAANAANTIDPVERMLGALTSTHITATMSPTGEVKSITGYKEMTDEIMANFNNSGGYDRKTDSHHDRNEGQHERTENQIKLYDQKTICYGGI